MRLGDALGKVVLDLAQGKSIDLQQVDGIRLEANRITAQLADLIRPSGQGLDPATFNGLAFKVLPHECASLKRLATGAAQSINSGAWTTLTYTAHSSLTEVEKLFSYSFGMTADPATGIITVAPVPQQAVFMISGWVQFDGNGTGSRALVVDPVIEGDASPLGETDGPNGSALTMSFCILKKVTSVNAQFRIQANQDSGGALDVQDACFQVTRIR